MGAAIGSEPYRSPPGTEKSAEPGAERSVVIRERGRGGRGPSSPGAGAGMGTEEVALVTSARGR